MRGLVGSTVPKIATEKRLLLPQVANAGAEMWSLKCTSLISLILLSRSLILTSGFSSNLETREVTVYGINSMMMLKHGYSWVTEDFELVEDINTVTFCLFFMLQYVDRDTALFLETDPTVYLLVENNQFLLRIGDDDIVDSNETLRFWRWTHLCVTLGTRTAIYVDGVRTTKIVSIQKYFQDEDHFTLRIGKSPTNSTSYAEPFSGLTTQAQVYFRSLTNEEISDLVSCNELKSGRETHGELKYEECIIKGQDFHCREHLRGSIGGQSGELAMNGDSSEEKDGDAKEGKSSNECNRRPHRHYVDSGDDCPITKLACMGKRVRNEICGPLLPKSYFLQQQVKKFTSIEAGDVCAKYDAHVAEYTPGMTSIITNGMPWIKSETPGQCVVMKNGLPANVSCSSTSFYVMCELDWDKKFQLRQRNLKEVIYLQLVSDESAIYFISRDNAVLIDFHTIRIYDEVYEADRIHLGRMVNLVNRKSNTTSTITLSTCNKVKCLSFFTLLFKYGVSRVMFFIPAAEFIRESLLLCA
ncbi:uncharacterized protein LOC135198289 [Macrobrachium nipponense]|uniref:uncharacterized protein LOC135198289 n=1 Tax=Macrobrachium nipponense TaxID=159736 RepID=UPI0030C87B3F